MRKGFGGHAIKVGRANAGMTVAAEVTVTEIVREDDDQVGQLLRKRGSGQVDQDGDSYSQQ